jgi:hypothetical protein
MHIQMKYKLNMNWKMIHQIYYIHTPWSGVILENLTSL